MSSAAKEWREIPGKYNLQRCTVCGVPYFPARSICPRCRRVSIGKMVPYSVCREWEVCTYSIVYEAPDCNNAIKPYVVALIRTKDGLMIASQISDVDAKDVKIGCRYVLCYVSWIRKAGPELSTMDTNLCRFEND